MVLSLSTRSPRKSRLKPKSEKENGPVSGRDAYYVAVDLLARREHSRAELEAKLAKREFTEEQIASAFELLLQHDLQSDQRYVEDFVRSRILKGNGPLKISHELRARGVDASTVDDYLNCQQIDWFEVATATYEKKYRSNDKIDAREQAKRVRFMQSKGFPGDIIFRLFK